MTVISTFESYLKGVCATYGINCIAEEMSLESLSKWSATRSVCKTIAEQLTVKHLFCDPNSGERKKIGIRLEKEIREQLGYGQVLSDSQVKEVDEVLKSEWHLREEFWLNRILEAKTEPVLFVLGSDHLDSFSKLLSQNGIQVCVLQRKWQT